MAAAATIKKTDEGYVTGEFKPEPPKGSVTKAPKKAAAAKAAAPKAKTKGQQIVDAYAKTPTASRPEIAASVGCTVGRVGEVVRAGLLPDGVGVGRGGLTKGEQILEWFRHNRGTCAECAAAVGCVPGRVGEVVRANPDLVRGEDGKYGAARGKAPRARKAAK